MSNASTANNLVSVVIPAFKAAEFIDETVRSVGAQRYRPVEVVVVEDCSPDETAQVVERAARRDSSEDFMVRLLRQPENRGGAAALSRGFHEATGEYLCWLSADDTFVGTSKLASQVNQLRSTTAAISFGQAFYQGASLDDGSAELITAHWHPRLPWLDSLLLRLPWARLIALLFVNPINGSTVMIARKAWESLGDFDAALRNIDQDSDLWMRYSALEARFAMIAEPSGFYRIHPGQTSTLREDCIVGASATRIRMIMALEESGLLGRLVGRCWPMLALAYRAGWHRYRPLVAEYLVERAVAVTRNPLAAIWLRRMGDDLTAAGAVDERLSLQARDSARSVYGSPEFTAFIEKLRERHV